MNGASVAEAHEVGRREAKKGQGVRLSRTLQRLEDRILTASRNILKQRRSHRSSLFLIQEALKELVSKPDWRLPPTWWDKGSLSLRVYPKITNSYHSHLWGLGPWRSKTKARVWGPGNLPLSLNCRHVDKSYVWHRTPTMWPLGTVHRYGLLAYPVFN